MSEAISTFTIRGVKEALKYLQPGQTALLRGRHGIGKSAVAYQMAKIWKVDGVIERRLSQLSEGDMIGLPDRGASRVVNGESVGITRFLPTDWFLEAQEKPMLVFLDEINRGTPEVMQACFQFVEKGELNGRKIHKDSRIIAAINFSKEYQVTHMDPAFLDRFWVADIEPDKQDWLDWASKSRADEGGGISEDVIDFIRQCNDDHFEIKSEKLSQLGSHEITPSRRSWERLDRHLNFTVDGVSLISLPASGVFYDVARGFVGPDAARALVKFQNDREQNISADDILNNFAKVKKKVTKLKTEASFSIVEKISSRINGAKIKLSQEQAKNLSEFMRVVPPEIAICVWNNLSNSSDVENPVALYKEAGPLIVGFLTDPTNRDKIVEDANKLSQSKANDEQLEKAQAKG